MTTSMETYSALQPFFCGKSVDSFTKGQWHGPLMFLCRQSKQSVQQPLDWTVIEDAKVVIDVAVMS